jgi:hypothetical protein
MNSWEITMQDVRELLRHHEAGHVGADRAESLKSRQELFQVPARGANVVHFVVPNAFLSASRSDAPRRAWMSGIPRSSS